MKFSSLAALEVVKMTTSSAARDENFIKMMTFPSQWYKPDNTVYQQQYYESMFQLDNLITMEPTDSLRRGFPGALKVPHILD